MRLVQRSGRIVAGTLAGALALSVTPIMGLTGTASAADALPPVADPIGAGNFCENGPTTEPFTDVADSDPSFDEIVCLVGTGLTTGVTATTYEPNSSITRRQMALFIKRLVDAANDLETGSLTDLPAYDGVPDYLDVAAESAAVKEAVGQLSQAGIVGGFPDDTYRPADSVSRRQMAAFINRAQDFLAGDPFTTTGDYFNDDNGDSGEDNLNALASVGIFQGNGAGNVFPGDGLTRRQMANILLRHAQVNFDAGAIEGGGSASTPGNATLHSDAPQGARVLQFDPSGSGVRPATYTFRGLDDAATYDVALLPVNQGGGYEDSVHALGGIWSFRDQDLPFDGLADDACTTSDAKSEIVSVNGVPVGDTCELDVSPVDGRLAIQLANHVDEADSAFLVVWDGSGNDSLDLDPADEPSEDFGVVGPIVWTGGECPSGTDVGGQVLYVDHAAKSIVTDVHDCTALYDAADTFVYDEARASTLAEIDAALSNGDRVATQDLSVNSTYSRTGPNSWDLTDDHSATPAGVTATSADSDTNPGDTSANDVTVSWTHAPVQAVMSDDATGFAGYCVSRWTTGFALAGETCFYFSDLDPVSDAVVQNRTVLLTDVPAGTWRYSVYAYSAASDYSDYSDPSSQVTTEVATGSPISVAASSNDADASSTITSGDVLTVTFDQTMDAATLGDRITLRDADGTVCTLRAANATFGYAGAVLSVTLTGAPLCASAGTVAGLQNGASVTGSSSIVDQDQGLDWSIVSSPDITF